MSKRRKDYLPEKRVETGEQQKDMKIKKEMRYHHIGIPTRIAREGEEVSFEFLVLSF